ncbi:hypothetical protein [Alteromonas mediterranea]|uniref:hypothetical protein n=1 Tax=Alteromonas mediterranea TaxID=314275 RepID=UPI000B219848|nr:hypothetical protein [Alteromonas mediterranea]
MKDEHLLALERDISNRLKHLNHKIEFDGAVSRVLLGKLLAKLNDGSNASLHDAEFRVFSQFGDDGIIQYLVNCLDIKIKKFIEFGVENYNESNTRFLLENNNWQGLVIDGEIKNVQYIRNTENYWRHDLTAICEFVTAENINKLITNAGFDGEIGLLHIDIDGNDYWVWKAITVVRPTIVVVEYNSLFGKERCITIPYEPGFARFAKHHSGLYAGASLNALCQLARDKGYCFIGSNSAGNNAYFVLRESVGPLPILSCEQGFVEAKFREHRDENGKLTFTRGTDGINDVRGLPVFNTQTQRLEKL